MNMNLKEANTCPGIADIVSSFGDIRKLKFTYRYSDRTFDGERDGVAAHTWCCLMIAEYLLTKLETLSPGKYSLDKLKVYQLIMFHDLPEAVTGDVDLDPSDLARHATKAEIEAAALPGLLSRMPQEISGLFRERLTEFEAKKTLESLFVKLVDVVEAEFQCFSYKHFWENWTEEYFIQKREKHFEPFPELKFIFDEVLCYYRENGYFSQ